MDPTLKIALAGVLAVSVPWVVAFFAALAVTPKGAKTVDAALGAAVALTSGLPGWLHAIIAAKVVSLEQTWDAQDPQTKMAELVTFANRECAAIGLSISLAQCQEIYKLVKGTGLLDLPAITLAPTGAITGGTPNA